jgi:hypothetical protein
VESNVTTERGGGRKRGREIAEGGRGEGGDGGGLNRERGNLKRWIEGRRRCDCCYGGDEVRTVESCSSHEQNLNIYCGVISDFFFGSVISVFFFDN